MFPRRPFATAFNLYHTWPVVGCIYNADTLVLPQLDELDKTFPDARKIRMVGSWLIEFEHDQLGEGVVAQVVLVSPPIEQFVTGWVYKVKLLRPIPPNMGRCLRLLNWLYEVDSRPTKLVEVRQMRDIPRMVQ
jgi:hypothetical protein